MTDYHKMYFHLYNRLTDVIIELQKIQQELEEAYIRDSDGTIQALPLPDKKPRQ